LLLVAPPLTLYPPLHVAILQYIGELLLHEFAVQVAAWLVLPHVEQVLEVADAAYWPPVEHTLHEVFAPVPV